jgi:hypothetical protein
MDGHPTQWFPRMLAVVIATATLVAACGADVAGDDGAAGADGPDLEETSAVDEFVGLGFDEAVGLAEAQERPWRIGRDGDEVMAVTDDLVVGRVTFEIDDGRVAAVTIETESGTSLAEGPPQDATLALLQSAAVVRIATTDNHFDSAADPFEQIFVASEVGGDPNSPLEPLALEVIAAELFDHGEVLFIDKPESMIEDLFTQNSGAAAVVILEEVRIDGDRAEVDLRLWCGSLCAVMLTYEAELGEDGWTILGTAGPIAVSAPAIV